jgi:mono/diheme cytochrome c family protein
MRRRLLLALALALLVAGCGGEETVSPAPETVIGTVPGAGTVNVEVFTETARPACSSCHTYGPADSNAKVGPNLDTSLDGKDAAFILESIVNPSAEITPGFTDIMPKDYATKLNQKQLADLVAFLQQG